MRAAILALLAEQPRNGYQIMQELEQRSHGLWRPSPGSVYPALQLLEDEGLVTSETGAGGRTYALTDAGRAYVEEHRDEVSAPWESMSGAADAPGSEMLDFMQMVKQVGSAVVQVATTGSPAQIAEARKVLANTRRALYRILAEEEGEEKGEE